MKYILYHDHNSTMFQSTVLDSVANAIIEKYPEHEFEIVDPYPIYEKLYPNCGAGCKYSPHHYLYVLNPDTGKYFLFSFWDRLEDIVNIEPTVTGWDTENIVEIFTSCGVTDLFCHQLIPSLDEAYTPWCYTYNNPRFHQSLDTYKSMTKKFIPSKPSFNGSAYTFREYLTKDSRFNVSSDILEEEKYYTWLASNKINFNINGAGEICHRDMEILAVKSALFREKLNSKFHNNLIPDYHYISVDCSDLKPTDQYEVLYKAKADRILDRYNEVIKDPEYLEFVADNGHQWWLENSKIDSIANISKELINIDKLDE